MMPGPDNCPSACIFRPICDGTGTGSMVEEMLEGANSGLVEQCPQGAFVTHDGRLPVHVRNEADVEIATVILPGGRTK